METTYWIGMDYHKEKTMLAVFKDHADQVVGQHVVRSGSSDIRNVLERYRSQGKVRACYEASSCGYGLARTLRDHGFDCNVVAPHSLSRSAATRVKKNDRLDAVQLARQYRSGGLKVVALPTEYQEQVRRFVRLLDETRAEARRVKTRITLGCLQFGAAHDGATWTVRHRAWLRELSLSALDREVLDLRLRRLDQLGEEIDRMTERCKILVKEAGGEVTVQRLMALKGISFGSAATLWAELWDGRRFSNPRKLMSFVGLDCKEFSSAEHEIRGSITKQGNARCRRSLVDGAGSYRLKAGKQSEWSRRLKGLSPDIVEYSRRAEDRLHRRYWHLEQSTGSALKAKVGVARELAGFVWGMMQESIPL
jgi:transposase